MLENEFNDVECSTGEVYSVPLRQFSLFEMFFVTTLSATAIGVYIYVSPFLVVFAGGWLIIMAILHVLQPQNLLVGGVLGFVASGLVAACILWTTNCDGGAITIAVIYPAMGYFYGACKAEFRDDSI